MHIPIRTLVSDQSSLSEPTNPAGNGVFLFKNKEQEWKECNESLPIQVSISIDLYPPSPSTCTVMLENLNHHNKTCLNLFVHSPPQKFRISPLLFNSTNGNIKVILQKISIVLLYMYIFDYDLLTEIPPCKHFNTETCSGPTLRRIYI